MDEERKLHVKRNVASVRLEYINWANPPWHNALDTSALKLRAER